MTDVQTSPDVESVDTERAEPARNGAGSTRRIVLLGAGAVGATAVLAACGTDSSTNSNGSDFSNNPEPAGSAAAPGGGSDGGGSNSGGGGSTLAATADIPQGGGIIVGDLVITQPVAGTYKAFSKVCTHAGCDVSKVDAGTILCPCHNSKFNIETGEPVSGPAKKALPETAVKVDGENIVAA